MSAIRLGAAEYLNARPLVYGLERDPRFTIRYDIPSQCARLSPVASGGERQNQPEQLCSQQVEAL